VVLAGYAKKKVDLCVGFFDLKLPDVSDITPETITDNVNKINANCPDEYAAHVSKLLPWSNIGSCDLDG
jgi:hypothetical protein